MILLCIYTHVSTTRAYMWDDSIHVSVLLVPLHNFTYSRGLLHSRFYWADCLISVTEDGNGMLAEVVQTTRLGKEQHSGFGSSMIWAISELVAGVAKILCLPLFAAGFSNRCHPLGMPRSCAYGRLLLVSFCTAWDSGHKGAVSSIFCK